MKRLFSEAQATSNDDRLFCRGLSTEKETGDFEEKTLYELVIANFLNPKKEIDNLGASEVISPSLKKVAASKIHDESGK